MIRHQTMIFPSDLPVILTVMTIGLKFSGAMKVSDFLNSEYLPSTLLLEEAALDSATEEFPAFNVTSDGDIRDAFVTMQYHRSMMNEYLCRSYVAEEILSELTPSQTVERLGVPAKMYRNHRPHDTLLKDQGSSSYRDWLTRSTLLDDVYRHYDQMGDADEVSQTSSEMESGEVTGYAVQSGGSTKTVPTSAYGPPTYSQGSGIGGSEMHYSGSSTHGQSGPVFSGHGGTGSHGQGSPVFNAGGGERGDEHHYYYPEEHSSGKGLALKDLFDLALTALAFLAFGMFIMSLIMNCMIGAQGPTVVMQTSPTLVTTAEATTSVTGRRLRNRRTLANEERLNEMAYRVLTSIDKLMELNQARSAASRSCLQYSLCKNNKYSRSLNNKYRIWLPVWSFGLSWLVGRLGEDRLSNLQASVLGLGNANCEKVYPTCSKR